MELKKFASQISGREYTHPQFTKEELECAKENGFLIIYGSSDDLLEIDGAFSDEADVWDGGVVHIQCEYEKAGQIIGGGVVAGNNGQDNVFTVKAKWCEERDDGGKIIDWSYETSVPHEIFDIMEEGHIYCRGIVIKCSLIS